MYLHCLRFIIVTSAVLKLFGMKFNSSDCLAEPSKSFKNSSFNLVPMSHHAVEALKDIKKRAIMNLPRNMLTQQEFLVAPDAGKQNVGEQSANGHDESDSTRKGRADVNDIISNIVKLLGGNVKVTGAMHTYIPSIPTLPLFTTRINNRGPPVFLQNSIATILPSGLTNNPNVPVQNLHPIPVPRPTAEFYNGYVHFPDSLNNFEDSEEKLLQPSFISNYETAIPLPLPLIPKDDETLSTAEDEYSLEKTSFDSFEISSVYNESIRTLKIPWFLTSDDSFASDYSFEPSLPLLSSTHSANFDSPVATSKDSIAPLNISISTSVSNFVPRLNVSGFTNVSISDSSEININFSHQYKSSDNLSSPNGDVVVIDGSFRVSPSLQHSVNTTSSSTKHTAASTSVPDFLYTLHGDPESTRPAFISGQVFSAEPHHLAETFDVTVRAQHGFGEVANTRHPLPKWEANTIITTPLNDVDRFVRIDGQKTFINLTPVRSHFATQAIGLSVSTTLISRTSQIASTFHIPPRLDYLPKQKPYHNIRIDTCIIGQDSSCDRENNEVCTTEDGISVCACRAGYSHRPQGNLCKNFDECSREELNDCDVNAKCHNVFGSFLCQCIPGYVDVLHLEPGRSCRPCQENFCNRRGECRVEEGHQICRCRDGYSGSRCEIDVQVLAVSVGATLAAIFVIILTLVLLCKWSRRWKKAQEKAVLGHTAAGFTFFGKNSLDSYLERLRWRDANTVPNEISQYSSSKMAPACPSSMMMDNCDSDDLKLLYGSIAPRTSAYINTGNLYYDGQTPIPLSAYLRSQRYHQHS